MIRYQNIYDDGSVSRVYFMRVLAEEQAKASGKRRIGVARLGEARGLRVRVPAQASLKAPSNEAAKAEVAPVQARPVPVRPVSVRPPLIDLSKVPSAMETLAAGWRK